MLGDDQRFYRRSEWDTVTGRRRTLEIGDGGRWLDSSHSAGLPGDGRIGRGDMMGDDSAGYLASVGGADASNDGGWLGGLLGPAHGGGVPSPFDGLDGDGWQGRQGPSTGPASR